MAEVAPHLFLGDARDAERLAGDMDLVVNCTMDVPFFSDLEGAPLCDLGPQPAVMRIRVPVNDSLDEREQRALYSAWTDGGVLDAIADHIARGRDVLVHCRMGRQRSAATVAALLMRQSGCSAAAAVEHVRGRKRDAFFPEVNFAGALARFEGGAALGGTAPPLTPRPHKADGAGAARRERRAVEQRGRLDVRARHADVAGGAGPAALRPRPEPPAPGPAGPPEARGGRLHGG